MAMRTMKHPPPLTTADDGDDFFAPDELLESIVFSGDGGSSDPLAEQQDLSVGDYLFPSPPQPEDSGDLLSEYIDKILTAGDIDLKFEHYPENYPTPFLELLSAPPPPLPSSDASSGSPGGSLCNSSSSPAGAGAGDWNANLESGDASFTSPFDESFVSGAGEVDLQWVESLLLSSPPAAPPPALPFARQAAATAVYGDFAAALSATHGDHHGRKHDYNSADDDEDDEAGHRRPKQSAVNSEQLVREMMDKVLLSGGDEACSSSVRELRQALQSKKKPPSRGGSRGKKKKDPSPATLSPKEVVDLDTLLIHCAQAVAADDRRSATEYLKQVKQHSSPSGTGDERLAHCFAEGLEARLAGTGSHLYKSFLGRRFASTDILKAYQLLLAACPFKKISHLCSDLTILHAVAGAAKVHIVDYGIYYGFQWPDFLRRLSRRPGGPPRVRITGIDLPQPGLRPGERIEETGRNLAGYAETFGVPFEYRAIPCQWENVTAEDLAVEDDEVVIVNSLYKFKSLVDESVAADSPRDTVLRTIRKLRPAVFVHGVVNGSYSAPFFVTRFKEALFHFSAVFDMLEANVPPENDEHRRLLEWGLFGREAINVISCEGMDRMERPETYKQWTARNVKAGLRQMPLSGDIMRRARDKVKNYHKDYIVDEDHQWLLQGWKGRILYALSAWTVPPESPATTTGTPPAPGGTYVARNR